MTHPVPIEPTRLRTDPVGLLRELARTHGGVVHFRVNDRPVFLVSDPARIHEVLVTQAGHFAKHQVRDRGLCLLGNGLMTSDDATNRAQRRHLSPLFSQGRLQTFIPIMARAAAAWRDARDSGEIFDIVEEMGTLTLDIAAQCLLDVDLEQDVPTIRAALLDCLAAIPQPDAEGRIREARRRLDAVVDPLIATRRSALDRKPAGDAPQDMISLLLAAGNADDLIRDEVVTMLLGAHETTASALGWIWWRLDRHRDVAAGLREEIAAHAPLEPPSAQGVTRHKAPPPAAAATTSDTLRLPYTRAVVSETLRLHSPGWIIGRVATKHTRLGDHDVPAGAVVMMSPAVVHRDPSLFPDPDTFDPTRFLNAPPRPRWAFFPFGGGARVCVGEQLAWLEMLVVLAVVASRWRFEAVPHHPIEEQALAALRPRWGIQVTTCEL